ncbi:unnamed protein product [Didymodactylos carnosus]|uniref:SWIM-type domain-containing protein n=1 Tax=Didymodactylos carnosus TaxID=1234261 RepID=A0A815WC14_9BILA|nr:unnamed protein product [Didymodactylos carnosus]CAF1542914.1 unnamed protein product [Didymodactylos carnosus]CAF3984490.1 unnamed protein product [Didymodactylos carnosus]CAF4403366.1 unnamed protein product [Didymodactylos carnosus]
MIKLFQELKEQIQNKDKMLNNLKERPPLNLDNHEEPMSDNNYHVLTGLTRDRFNDLCSHIPPSSLRHSDIRTPRMAIAILLVKLRLDLSHQALCTLFGLEEKMQISRILDSTCSALGQYFVPKHLGFGHITRTDVIQKHTRPLAQQLLVDDDPTKAIIILDGTYVCIQKSHNNVLQRRSFSLHKGKPLVKPMMVVSSDGYIIAVLGPFFADGKNNDSEITKHLLYNNVQGFQNWMKPGDVIVVDRGFRDCLADLQKFGYETKMPLFLKKDQTQYTTAEANKTRLITKVRWVIESANGRVKQWRFFSNIVPNTMIEKIGSYFEIVCALINCYRPVFVKDTSKDKEIDQKILELAHETNKIKEYIDKIKDKSEKQLKWTSINATDSVSNFPKMDFDELQVLTLGTYQLKQARSYITEHLSEDGAFLVKVANKKQDLLRARIQSRHRNAVKYELYIQYNNRQITGWYCKCPNGSRVVGCCAHIASVMYYLAFARYNPEHLQPRSSKYYASLTDAVDYSEVSDTETSDEDEDDSNTLYYLV